jgi:hypothetical protein
MKNMICALSLVFAVCVVVSTGCGGQKENTVIEAPANAPSMSQADAQSYEAAQKASADNEKK